MAQDPFTVRRHAWLDAAHVDREIRRFLAEDVGRGDVTSERVVPRAARASAAMVARQACVAAGLPLARAVFLAIDPEIAVTDRASDGDRVAAGAVLATIEGPAGPILTGERVALNLVQRLSGIATLTRAYVDAIAGTGACVSDTRKTTPGLRVFEKYAVHVGGGRNHRIGLYDAILIKDNHRAIAGGAAAAVMAALARDALGTTRSLVTSPRPTSSARKRRISRSTCAASSHAWRRALNGSWAIGLSSR